MITAVHADDVLTISGSTNAQNDFGIAAISLADSAISIFVSSTTDYAVTPSGDPAPFRTIDASGLSNASIEFSGNFGLSAPITVTGSRLNDYFFTGNDFSNTFDGYKGNDTIFGGAGGDMLSGGRGADLIYAGNADDTITGGRGNDTMKGAGGVDVLVFSGNFADYTLSRFDIRYQIKDNVGTDGLDTFDGFEMLQFADQTVQIEPFASSIQGEVIGDNLVFGGSANTTSDTRLVTVQVTPSQATATDNGTSGVVRDYEQDGPLLTSFDGRTFSGAGIDLRLTGETNGLIRGSAQGDLIEVVYNDGFSGPTPSQTITAKNGDDTVFAGFGNDVVTGGRGDDLLNGWFGNDSIVFSGDFAAYDLQAEDGHYTITHLNAGQDGSDVFANFEQAIFADQTIALAAITSNVVVARNGTELSVSGQAAGGNQGRVAFDWDPDGAGYLVTETNLLTTVVQSSSSTQLLNEIDFGGLTQGGGEFISLDRKDVTLFGSNQDDFFSQIAGAEVAMFGRDGDDTLSASNGDDTLDGGKGDDFLFGDNGDDLLIGGRGNDDLDGGNSNDTLAGNNGADTLDGGFGFDAVSGGKGDDLLFGGFADDTISGGKGDDEIYGGNGNDIISSGRGDDFVDGESGEDVMLFAYDFAEYTLSQSGGPVLIVNHTGGNRRDGNDRLEAVETLQFNDTVVAVDDLVF